MANKTSFTCPSFGKLMIINSRASAVKLVFWGSGATRNLAGGKHVAGEIMFEFPDRLVCHADSFFIGHPIPALAIDDKLLPGQTYFVIPIDRLGCNILSASSLAALNPNPQPTTLNNSRECPFEYVKGENGRVLIKVTPQFIIKLMLQNHHNSNNNNDNNNGGGGGGLLCSTPELKKHYEQLVGSREQVWSPKLETISEHKIRFSPCRFIGLERKQKEKSVL